jgi:uncharacterized protein (DUF427 family)
VPARPTGSVPVLRHEAAALTHGNEYVSLISMTKRLQVLFDDDELADIQREARRERKTTAAWVRDTLRAARARTTYPDPEPKLRAIREAMSYSYPTGDVTELLADIERGYLDEHD